MHLPRLFSETSNKTVACDFGTGQGEEERKKKIQVGRIRKSFETQLATVFSH